MKQIVWIVLGLTATVTAQAASFDCAKASTKVELIICDNTEISKLDDGLAASYKTALEDQSKADSIKQAQKQWMWERNSCADAVCVKRAYHARLSSLERSGPMLDDGNTSPDNDASSATATDTKKEWHCEQESTLERRKNCEEIRDAKPYRYEIKSELPGKGYSLCELMLDNMRAQTEPMSCELKIAPKFKKYFSLPDWEDIDPWADIDLLWKMEMMGYGSSPAYDALRKLTKEQWLEQFRHKLEQNNVKLIMRRARFDLNGDGKKDLVLAYAAMWDQPCNPWQGGQGYHLYILSEDGKSLSKYADPTGGQVPFFFSLKDPRFPGAQTYRFTFYDVGKFADHLPRQIDIYGSSSGDGVERILACHFELLKLQTHSTDR
jgi:uncharacterized protein